MDDIRALAHERLWDRARLDADYTARTCVSAAEFERIIGLYAERSKAALALAGNHLALRFDDLSDERMDVFATVPGQLRPVVLFIHGGYWRALSRQHSAFMAPMLAEFGIATAVPDYTLAPAASLTEITRQMRAAVAWLWQNGPALGIDRSRIVVAGSSAGGHLAAALVMPGWQAGFGLPERAIRAALPVSGLFELAPLASSHIQDWMRFTDAELAALSPLRHLPAPRVPMVVALAGTETAGFERQSAAYAQATGADLLRIEGRNHFDVILDLCSAQNALSGALLRLCGIR